MRTGGLGGRGGEEGVGGRQAGVGLGGESQQYTGWATLEGQYGHQTIWGRGAGRGGGRGDTIHCPLTQFIGP